jgi:hypothetical protein
MSMTRDDYAEADREAVEADCELCGHEFSSSSATSSEYLDGLGRRITVDVTEALCPACRGDLGCEGRFAKDPQTGATIPIACDNEARARIFRESDGRTQVFVLCDDCQAWYCE